MTSNFWVQIIKQNWNLDVSLEKLVGEYDLNFFASTNNLAETYILKVMRSECSKAFISAQCAILTHLNNCDAPTPKVIKSSSGNDFITVKDETGVDRIVWIIGAFKGDVYAKCKAKPLSLASEIGHNLAVIDLDMQSFKHDYLDQNDAELMKWNLAQANWIKDEYRNLFSEEHAQIIKPIINGYESAQNILNNLPQQAIHNDLNDYNILIEKKSVGKQRLSGIIDFGDMILGAKICNLAICAAYVILDVDKPLEYLQSLVFAYHQKNPLTQDEISILWRLICMRLAVSVVNSALMKQARPDDIYVTVSEAAAWRMLERIEQYSDLFITQKLLNSCGFDISLQTKKLNKWLKNNIGNFAPMFDCKLSDAPMLDWSVAGKDAATNAKYPDMAELQAGIDAIIDHGKPSLGCYSEPRLVYASDAFFSQTLAEPKHQANERRTVHIAIDVFLPAGTPVHSPYGATVHSTSIQDADFDYGGLVTLKHTTEGGLVFYTLYGHLAWAEVSALAEGQTIAKGEVFAKLGDYNQNGTWPPHVHFQLGLEDIHGEKWDGVVNADDLEIWQNIYPDPAPLLNLEFGHATSIVLNREDEYKRRKAWSGTNLSLTYDEPLLLQRGYECQMYDEWGRTYLDAFNNVPHVGHANKRLAKVVARQMQMLNTNTRYLHQSQSNYAERMLEKMPDHIDCIFFLNSASEANELAIRMAREYTGSKHTIVSESGYHGNTLTATDLSEYKFNAKGGKGAKDWVHIVPIPDGYRGEFKDSDPDAGAKYAQYTQEIIDKLTKKGEKIAAFITESFPSVGGQIIPPKGYLKAVFEYTRAAGGIAIADEVQTGMGRLGKYFWGFEQQDAVPDMIILGKPIGNGHPIGILATTRKIANKFANGMEFFSTFGGSTLSCTIGNEVLRIVEDEKLQENAEKIGTYLLNQFKLIQKDTPSIGDVRGLGLFIGVEMIESDGSPSAVRADYIANRMVEKRILIGTDGPHHNVLKLRAPLIFSKKDADYLLHHIQIILAEQQDLVW